MLAIGIGTFAVAMYFTAGLTNEASFVELFWPQVLRGFALMFCFLPANLLALGTLRPDQLKNGAGLYNLTRDLGGAIGLAALGTVLTTRQQFHWNRLIESINPARRAVSHFLELQEGRLGDLANADPHHAAVKLLEGMVQREALVMSFNDALLLLGGIFAAALVLMPLVRTPRSALAADRH